MTRLSELWAPAALTVALFAACTGANTPDDSTGGSGKGGASGNSGIGAASGEGGASGNGGISGNGAASGNGGMPGTGGTSGGAGAAGGSAGDGSAGDGAEAGAGGSDDAVPGRFRVSTRTFRAVAAATYHTCGVHTDGTLACWGFDEWGQASPPAGAYASIVVSTLRSCALGTNGEAVCFGGGENAAAAPPDGQFRTLTMTDFDVCGLTSDGVARCTGERVETHLQAREPGYYLAIALNPWCGCGIRANARLLCESANNCGAEGLTGTLRSLSPSATRPEWCAIQTNGSAVCSGMLAELSPPPGTFLEVSTGHAFVCGVRSNGTLECWGRNDADKATPPEGVFTGVTAGTDHACALRDDGRVVCWGNDAYGQSTPP
jgi:alpha-tubulin suppressor-like RCC1 family protein